MRIHQNRLRSLEAFTGSQFPAKILRLNTDYHTDTPKLTHLGLCDEIPGIYQLKAKYFPGFLPGILSQYTQKRMLLMAAFPTV